ncbi:serine/threonine protein kinase [Hahella ganghwensis]|uniref:serine/threonine protein kinase n=1 Tax=Hahella ganghwensis TaxID=286420 RepID=UPI00037DD982|nr:serine/threonine-protein kinase [Hahella ganghwensis]
MSDTQIFEPETSGTRSFGKYKVVKELGRGAMGVVYQCFDPDFERTVAVKILSPELLSHDTSGEYRQRFKNEMKAAGRLSHPNVINVYDAGEQDGVPYFVMEYVDGIELKEALDSGERFELSRTMRIMKDILSGLKYIHEHGITHRDLKPANIFITRNGTAKITDFGIAKLESSELTRVGTIIGSPRYMSPEQCQGLPVDNRSDLFSAGIILYQLLTNEHCFDANSPTAIMQKIIHSTPEAPSVLIPTMPKPYDKVVFRALEKFQDKRFQDAGEFIAALEQAAAGKVAGGPSRVPKLVGASAGVLMGAVAAIFLLPQILDNQSDPLVSGSNAAQNLGAASTDESTTSAQADQIKNSTPETENADNSAGVASGNNVTSGGSEDSETPGAETSQTTVSVVETSGSIAENNSPDAGHSGSDLEPELAAKVDKLLRVAKVHQLQGRLVTPSGSSAYDAYRIVLDIDPDNVQAVAGMESLERTLITRIQELRQNGNTDLAHNQAVAGAKVFPENEELVRMAAAQ